MSILVTVFDSVYRQTGSVTELSFTTFDHPQVCASKIESRAFSPAAFHEGDRRRLVMSLSCLVFDYDGHKTQGLPVSAQRELFEAVQQLGCAYVLHSTWSSTNKFRLILPLAEPVSVDRYKPLHAAVAWRLLPGYMDPSCNQPTRLFYLPSVPSDSAIEDYVLESNLDLPRLKPTDTDSFVQDINGVQVHVRVDSPESYHLALSRSTTKNEDLNKYTYMLAAREAADPSGCGDLDKFVATLWPFAELGLRSNKVSSPVRSWRAAQDTFERACRDGWAQGLSDADSRQVSDRKLLAKALGIKPSDTLVKWSKELVKTPAALKEAAKALSLHNQLDVRAMMLKALEQAGELDLTDVQQRVDAALQAAQTEVNQQAARLHKRTSVPADWADLALELDKSGFPIPHEDNVSLCLRAGAQHIVRSSRTLEVLHLSAAPWHTWHAQQPFPMPVNVESETLAVMDWVKPILGRAVSSRVAKTALKDFFESQPPTYDPFLMYLESLQWDGKPRLDTWLTDLCGAEQSVLTSQFGRKWLLSAVQRTFHPGCKADTALILCGPQGVGKSSTLAALVPERNMFADNLPALHTADVHVIMSDLVIVELAELHQLTSRTQAELIKAFMSCTHGKVRPAYAHSAQTFLRRAIIAGSTNELSGFLTDATGGRRFWPVEVAKCDVQAVRACRDQLWAEAVMAYRNGEHCYLTAELERAAETLRQDKHVVRDERVLRVQQFMDGELKELYRPYTRTQSVSESEIVVRVFSDQFAPGSSVPLFISPTQVYELLGCNPSRTSQQVVNNIMTKAGLRKSDLRTKDTARACLWTRVE